MTTHLRAALAGAALFLTSCSNQGGTPVRASLADGQVILGQVETDVLRLDSGLGMLLIPLADVGEVVPVEGERLSDSNDHVTVWLRDGSELRGRWDEPELRMSLDVGDELVGIDLPMEYLVRFQLQSGFYVPDTDVFRVITTFGDDFLVDAQATRVVIDNDLGVFSPFLSECRSVRPVADPKGDWRVELTNGSVLIGPLADASFTFSLLLGPDPVTVSLDQLVSLERQWWTLDAKSSNSLVSTTPAESQDAHYRDLDTAGTQDLPVQAAEITRGASAGTGAVEPADFALDGEPELAQPARRPASLPAPTPGWYDRSAFEYAKH